MRKRMLVTILALSLFTAIPSLANPVLNGSFEYRFSGWNTLGRVYLSTSYYGFAPTDRTYMGTIVSTGASISNLSTFLGVEGWNGAGDFVAGAAITQKVIMLPGQTITFDWAFRSTEQGMENDRAFLFINSNRMLLSDSNSLWGQSGLNGFTGWRHAVIDAPSGGGAVQISLVAVNVVDDYMASTLYVDNFQPNRDVPEPPPFTTLGAALVFFAAGTYSLRAKPR